MSLKRVLPILLVFALASMVLLTACGSSNGQNGSNQNASNTITIWHSWEGDYLQAKKAIFDDYMRLHPGVTIKLVQQDHALDKAITAVKVNNGPDILAGVNDQLGKLASSRTVIPLDQYLSSDFIKNTYSKQAGNAVMFKNKVYGVPETVEAITFMYNKKLIKESELPKTTDDLLAFAQKYQQEHPGHYGVVWNTTDGYTDAAWFYGFGAYYVKDDGTVGLNTPQAVEAASYIASFRPYMPRQISYDVASSLFTEGKAAIMLNGPWAYSDYVNKAGIDLGVARLPMIAASNQPARPFVGVKSLWVTGSATNVALCADILKFYTNAENQLAMVKSTGEVPANAKAVQDSVVTTNPAIAGYALQAQDGIALPSTPYMSAVWQPIADALTAIWSGSQTPREAFDVAQGAATKGVQSIQS